MCPSRVAGSARKKMKKKRRWKKRIRLEEEDQVEEEAWVPQVIRVRLRAAPVYIFLARLKHGHV